MATNKSGKGNPASHRMGNKELKARRERCWRNGEKRKDARRAANEAQCAANREMRAAGVLTAWQAAKAVRAAYRADDPAVRARRLAREKSKSRGAAATA